ncbi:hypothetical protein [Prosthecobacter sp.]|uniref:hypothetical protein n=1 Tax=Prosthecobacter sp. TaxID=1965333 RepID=UPI0037833133
MRTATAVFVFVLITLASVTAANAGDSLQLRRAARRAIADGNIPLYAALLQAGLQIDQSISDVEEDVPDPGLTALMFAVAWGKSEMVAWLRDQGAYAPSPSLENIRPIDLALAMKRDDLAEMLKVPTEPNDAGKGMPGDAVEFLGDLFIIPESLQVFVSLNGADPPDEFTKEIAKRRDQTFPASMASGDPTRLITRGDLRVWFSNRISDETGVKLAVTAQPVPDQKAWDIVCQVEGRPVVVPSGTETVSMPVEKVTGRLVQRHGWWVLENRQPALSSPVPQPPKVEARHADLAPLVTEVCWQGNVTLMTALIDAGVDPAAALDPNETYPVTLVERAAWSNNPRFMGALLSKKPELRANRGLLYKAAHHAFEQGNEAALAALEAPVSGAKSGSYPVEMIDDLLGDAFAEFKEPLFFTINDADPDKEIMAQIKKHLPTAVPFSEAVSGTFKQEKGEVFGSSYHLKSNQKNGTKIEIKISPEKDGTWSYSIRDTRGFLAGGGTKGRLVFSHGYWFSKDEQHWEE